MILYVLTGIPGSGKTTFVKNHISNLKEPTVHISRDEIRFSILKEGDEYFSKEDEVFETFVKQISDKLNDGYDVFADATHLSPGSRYKLLSNITLPKSYVEINSIFLKTPLKTCLKRNEKRKGTKTYVPPAQIEKMYKGLREPQLDEGFNTVYIIKPNSPIERIVRV